ncbi:AEC family transporter [Thioclava sp. BHET1]|nr:AEC family transporter [Thioclava sp. BHET1]
MLLFTIWPLFALICLGFVLNRAGFPAQGFWPAAERLNYFVLFPALLVSSLINAPVHDPAIWRLGGAALATIAVAAVLLYALRRLWSVPARRFGPALQGVVRFNTYLGLALTARLAGPEGLSRAALVLAVAVPFVNVLSILALSETRSPLAIARNMLRNPLILACVAGLALASLGAGLPFGMHDFLVVLARGSLPLGLLCVGAALQITALRGDLGPLLGNAALRLLAMPLLAAGIGHLFGLAGTDALVLVVFCAIPTATSAYVLTRQLGGDGPFMAGIVTA